jgi:tetratricopeptide (TPR) repeat protein
VKRHAVIVVLTAWLSLAAAVPLRPASDDEVVERLPAATASRSALARARQSPQAAAALARVWIEQARRGGDPRPAGQAIALLKPWVDSPLPDAQAVLMMATAEQYLHEFDPALRRLLRLVQSDPAQPQAWLTIATLQRLQGRYAASDAACARLMGLRLTLYAQACSAENEGLRGHVAAARAQLGRLIASSPDRGLRAWLLTTLAELEERAGDRAAAQRAYRSAWQAAPDGYTAMAYADFLIAQERGQEARALLKDQARSDAVLLRMVLANPEDDAGRAAAAELRARFAQADQRPGAALVHARERALFALRVDHDPVAALALARANVRQQREPLDLLVLAEAARASGQPQARDEARRIVEEIGLVDHRLQAML